VIRLATFVGLALAALQASPARAQEPAGFEVQTRLELGASPRQIAFDDAGTRAFVVVEGENAVRVVDARAPRLHRAVLSIATPLPLGVAYVPPIVPPPGDEREAIPERLLVSRFGSAGLSVLAGEEPAVVAELTIGAGPSYLTPLGDGRFLVPAEEANQLWLVDVEGRSPAVSFPTGARPFPTGATSDARLAFCPNYDDGTVTVVDLFNGVVGEPVPVGEHPSGATVLPEDVLCAVPVRGADEVVLLNTASRERVGAWTAGPDGTDGTEGGTEGGIGDGPFTVVVSPDGRLAFVANVDGDDVSVVDLHAGPMGRIVARFPTGEAPIAMAVEPGGAGLWVSCDGSHEVWVHAIPERWRAATPAAPEADGPATVGILGMIHGDHETSERWSLERVRAAVLAFEPDALLVEIPPAHFDAAWAQVVAGDPVTEERTRVFPEYTDCLLHLALREGIDVVPCAGWSKELSLLRSRRVAEFREDAERLAAYEAAQRAALAPWDGEVLDSGDPHVLHSARYDVRIEDELEPYDRFLNDWIGPGGWTNVNRAHMALVHRAIDERPGERLLVTFGAGHKHWFRAALERRARERGDVELAFMRPYLGPAESTMEETCAREVRELHRFFEDWFRGRLPATDTAFARFERVMAPGFEIVNPAGETTGRERLLSGLLSAHGRWRDESGAAAGTVRVAAVRVRPIGEGLFVVAYEEWQTEGGRERGRRSTAVLRRTDRPTPLGLEWLVVHETWLDGDGR